MTKILSTGPLNHIANKQPCRYKQDLQPYSTIKYSVSPAHQHSLIRTFNVLLNKIRSRGYKTSFMLNSAEHEIVSANKYENANNSWHFHIY